MRKRSWALVFVVVAAVAILGVVYYSYAKKAAGPTYVTAEAKLGDVAEIVTESGTVTADQRDLYFEQGGTVKSVAVQVGDHVKAGDALMTIGSETLDAELAAAQATLDAAEGKLAQLYAGSTSQDVTIAQTAVDNAQIALAKAMQSQTDSAATSTADVSLKEQALTSAQSALANAQAKAASDLASAESGARIGGEQALTDVSVALGNADLTLGIDNEPANDAYEQDLSIMNSGALLDAQNNYVVAKAAVATANAALASAADDTAVSAALAQTLTAVDDGMTVLDNLTDVLNATVAVADISQDTINGKIAATNTDRVKLAADKATVSAAAQTLATTLVTNQTTVQAAENAEATAQQELNASEVGQTTDGNTATSAVQVAQGALQAAKDQLAKVQAGPRAVDASAYAADVRQAQAQVDQLQTEVAKNTLIAPTDGMIADVPLKEGEIAGPSVRALTFVSDAAFDVEADVAELDISRVTPGDTVALGIEALDNLQTTGTVRRVDPTEKIVSGDVFYNVVIDFDQPPANARAGMSADATITTETHTGVLTVPVRSVFRSGKENVVRVLENGVVAERTVQVGLRGLDDAEILSGLSAGDVVVVSEKP